MSLPESLDAKHFQYDVVCFFNKCWSVKIGLLWSYTAYKFSTGDELGLRETLLSINSHVSNEHSFPGTTSHKKCCHGDLAEDRDKDWIKPGSFALKKLDTAIRGKNNGRLDDIPFMLGFTHTGWHYN